MTLFLMFIRILACGFVTWPFKRRLLLSIVLASSPVYASVDDESKLAVQTTPGSANCMPMSEISKFNADEAGFIVNNFSVREVRDLQSDMVQLETTYSIVNRSSQAVRISADFVFLDKDNSILAALNANPEQWRIEPLMTTMGQGRTFVSPGTAGVVKTVCLRIFGTLPDKRN